MAGHLVGTQVTDKMSDRVFVEADPRTGETRLLVSYHVLGDTVTIRDLKILIAANSPSSSG